MLRTLTPSTHTQQRHLCAAMLQTTCHCHTPLTEVLLIFSHALSAFLQPSSTLSSYVSACAYSTPNQYGVYSGPAGGYVAPGHHHWQPQSTALSHPGSGMSMHAGEIHSPMAFKHQVREGILYISQSKISLLKLLLLLYFITFRMSINIEVRCFFQNKSDA